MSVRSILAAALVAAAPALAASAETCPTNADLEDGIRLTRADPFFSVVFTDTIDGLAEARVMQRDGATQEVDTVYLHPLAVSTRTTANGVLSVQYATDSAGLDDLAATQRWDSLITLSMNDNPFTQGSYTAVLTGFGQATIGNCNYDVWRVRDLLSLDNGAVIAFEKSYAPDLGLIVGSIQLDENDAPLGSVFFDEITAE